MEEIKKESSERYSDDDQFYNPHSIEEVKAPPEPVEEQAEIEESPKNKNMKTSPPQEEMNPYIVPNSQTMFDHNEADTTERTH